MINFSANVNIESRSHCDIAVNLQRSNAKRHSDIFTFKDHIPCANTTATISMSGIIIENFECCCSEALQLKLVSPDSLMVEDSMLSIVEI